MGTRLYPTGADAVIEQIATVPVGSLETYRELMKLPEGQYAQEFKTWVDAQDAERWYARKGWEQRYYFLTEVFPAAEAAGTFSWGKLTCEASRIIRDASGELYGKLSDKELVRQLIEAQGSFIDEATLAQLEGVSWS